MRRRRSQKTARRGGRGWRRAATGWSTCVSVTSRAICPKNSIGLNPLSTSAARGRSCQACPGHRRLVVGAAGTRMPGMVDRFTQSAPGGLLQPGMTSSTKEITHMKRSDLTEKLLDIKRDNGWSWKYICEKIGGYSEVLIVGAILGQMKLTKPQAANAGELFGLSKSEVAMLNETPMRGEGTPMPPTDTLIYRFYELVMVNGPAWQALIEEEYGDGIMSAIDFDMVMERLPNPKSDRVKITMTGKFLPYKYYGASGNVPEYGFKEG